MSAGVLPDFKPASFSVLLQSLTVEDLDIAPNMDLLNRLLDRHAVLHLSHWPDIPILILFCHLSLPDAYHLGVTCRRFYQLFKSAGPRRTQLRLEPSCSGDPCTSIHCLHLSQRHLTQFNLDEAAQEQNPNPLVSLLPNITDLTIVYPYEPYYLHESLRLFEHWRPKLIRLKLLSTEPYRMAAHEVNVRKFFQDLMQTINQMSALKHLTISLYNRILPRSGSPPLSLTILNQLESFSFDSHDSMYKILDLVSSYATVNERLKELELHNRIVSLQDFQALLKLDKKLSTKVTSFDLINPLADIPFHYYTSLFSQYTSLTQFRLILTTPTLNQLAACLQPLTHLTHLFLHVDQGKRARARHQARAAGERLDPEEGGANLRTLQPLRSVTHLTISLNIIDTHYEVNWLHLPHLCPNVEALKISIYRCLRCHPGVVKRFIPLRYRADFQLLKCCHRVGVAFRDENDQYLHEAFPRLQKITFQTVHYGWQAIRSFDLVRSSFMTDFVLKRWL